MKAILSPALYTIEPKLWMEGEHRLRFKDQLTIYYRWIRNQTEVVPVISDWIIAKLFERSTGFEWTADEKNMANELLVDLFLRSVRLDANSIHVDKLVVEPPLDEYLPVHAEDVHYIICALLDSENVVVMFDKLDAGRCSSNHKAQMFHENISRALNIFSVYHPEKWIIAIDWTDNENWVDGDDESSRNRLINGIKKEIWLSMPDWDGEFIYSEIDFSNGFMKMLTKEDQNRQKILQSLGMRLILNQKEAEFNSFLRDERIKGLKRKRRMRVEHGTRIHYEYMSNGGIRFLEYNVQHQDGLKK